MSLIIKRKMQNKIGEIKDRSKINKSRTFHQNCLNFERVIEKKIYHKEVTQKRVISKK